MHCHSSSYLQICLAAAAVVISDFIYDALTRVAEPAATHW